MSRAATLAPALRFRPDEVARQPPRRAGAAGWLRRRWRGRQGRDDGRRREPVLRQGSRSAPRRAGVNRSRPVSLQAWGTRPSQRTQPRPCRPSSGDSGRVGRRLASPGAAAAARSAQNRSCREGDGHRHAGMRLVHGLCGRKWGIGTDDGCWFPSRVRAVGTKSLARLRSPCNR